MKTKKYSASEFIDSPEMAAAYLAVSLEENGMEGFLKALGEVAKAKGMTQVSKEIGSGRQSLYKSLSEDGNPQFETIMKLLAMFNLKFEVVPKENHAA
jgi:probable addiction module antidote protein